MSESTKEKKMPTRAEIYDYFSMIDLDQYIVNKSFGDKSSKGARYIPWANALHIINTSKFVKDSDEEMFNYGIVRHKNLANVGGTMVEVEEPFERINNSAQVTVFIELCGHHREITLAVMNGSNKAEPLANVDSVAVNKAYRRALVKLAAESFGLGIRYYSASEDDIFEMDFETGEYKTVEQEPVQEDVMSFEEAMGYLIEAKGKAFGLKMSEIVTNSKNREGSLNLLKKFAEGGTTNDRKAAKALLAALEAGKISFPEVSEQ